MGVRLLGISSTILRNGVWSKMYSKSLIGKWISKKWIWLCSQHSACWWTSIVMAFAGTVMTKFKPCMYVCPAGNMSYHYSDVMMGVMAYRITNLTIVYLTVYLGEDQRKHQSSASLAFVTGEFPAQMASNAENVYIWWRHHVISCTVKNDDANLDNYHFGTRAWANLWACFVVIKH